jgi:photosystem II stability/assembly factor-like uncharacterized protein
MKKVLLIIFLTIVTSTLYPQWVQINSPINEYLKKVSFYNENTGFIVSGNKILLTSNGGTNWSISTPTGYNIQNVLCLSQNTAFAVGDSGIILKTTNYGTNWQLLNSGYTYQINTLSFINLSTGFLAGNFSGTLITTNGGLNWNYRTGPNPNYTVWFTSSDTGYIAGEYRYFTTNQGVSWFPWTPQQGHSYSFSKIHGTTPSNVWTCWYESWWTPQPIQFHQEWCIHNGTTIHYYNEIISNMHVVNSQKAFIVGGAVGSGKIFRTIDGGTTLELQQGTQNAMYGIWMVNENTGYAVGMGGLIYKTTNGGVTGITPINNSVPDKFSLSQNYPNPFNPTTIIRFKIKDSRFVTLKVYNILGKEIESLVNEKQSPGIYEVKWNGANYPSGIYFYRLQVGDYTETKKMILVK